MAKQKINVINKVFASKFCGNFTVIEESNVKRSRKKSFICEFDEENGVKYRVGRTIQEIKVGNIKNPFLSSIFDVGYLGGVSCVIYKKEYTIWFDMMRRCYDKKRKDYKWYGEVGIEVCKEWHNFSNFVLDIKNIEGYNKELFESNKLQLDKDILKTKEYSLLGCKFVSKEDNLREMLDRIYKKDFLATYIKTKYIEAHDNITVFAKKYNLSQSAISDCLHGKRKAHKGWIFEFTN